MKAKDNQSMIDISMQKCGSPVAAFAFAKLNGISVTDDPSGLELILPQVVNSSVSNYFADRSIVPATASNDEITDVSRVFFQELPVEFS